MRLHHSAVPEIPITAIVSGTLPKPTFIGVTPIYLFPESIRYGADWFNANMMAVYERNRLSFSMSEFGIGSCRNRGGLSASTFAEFHRGLLRGMILHVVSPPKTTDQARELQLAWHFLLGFYQSIIAYLVEYCNGEPTPAFAQNGAGQA